MLNFSSTESEGGEIDVLSVSPKKGPDRKKWKRKCNLALYQSKKKRRKVHQTPYPANPDPDEVNPDEVAAESGQATTPYQASPDNEAITPPPSSRAQRLMNRTASIQHSTVSTVPLNPTSSAPNRDDNDVPQPTESAISTSMIFSHVHEPTSNLENAECSSRNVNEPSAGGYVERCIDEINSSSIIPELLQKFHDEGLLRHFMAFLRLTASGTIPATQISTLLNLEMSMLHSLQSTTQMRYRADTCLFWETVLSVGGPKLLRLFASDKHFGKVNSNICDKSKYQPALGNFNFAVPDERILRKSKTFIPKEIKCGIIEDSLSLLDPNKEYIISFDGKQTGLGLRKECEGDVNLWGFEGPPTLEEMNLAKKNSITSIEEIAMYASDNDSVLNMRKVVHKLKYVVQMLSFRIKALRQAKVRHEILKSTFTTSIKKNPSKGSRYQLAFADIEVFISRADKVIQDLLNLNLRWCQVMSDINCTSVNFRNTNVVDLSNQENMLLLLEPTLINTLRPGYLATHPHFVKQRSPEWFQLRRQSRLTASTMHSALGLRGLKALKDHHDEYVLQRNVQRTVTPAMTHGTNHEVKFSLRLSKVYLYLMK